MKLHLILYSIAFLPFISKASTSYVQNFDTFANGTTNLGDGTVLSSSSSIASVQSGALRLTLDGEKDDLGVLRIPGLVGSATGWSASFTVTVGSSGLPADGFSFAWGAGITMDPLADASGDEEGWGGSVDHLYFAFDTFDNGGGDWGLKMGASDGTTPVIFANVAGELIGVEETALAQISISWDPIQGASFHTTGFNTNINATNIPTYGFTPADTNIFAFGARTGELTETLSFDNINIQSVPEPTSACLALTGLLAVIPRRRKAQRI